MGRLKQPKTKVGKYFLNVFIAFDQLGNAFWGGDPDETISSRLGKLKRRNDGKIARPIPRAIDRVLDRIDPNHSIKAIEEDEGKDAVVDKNGYDGWTAKKRKRRRRR